MFGINSQKDIIATLKILLADKAYMGHKGMPFWITDQLYLFRKTREWGKKTDGLVILNDTETGYRRLDRHRIPSIDTLKELIPKGVYTDYHMFRPYDSYKNINDTIVGFLSPDP